MRALADASVDAIVTDPPYGISFLGKDWDHGVPGEAYWREALRVAKPGAHMLAFGGTRTYHRLPCAIEDAGWEIRDCVMWVYGNGFPKNHDISKAIDKAAGAERPVVGEGNKGDAARTCMNDASGNGRKKDYLAGPYDITAPATDDAHKWDGWGTALKPSVEPVVLARKPLSGTVAANVLEHGTGAINIGACRIERGDAAYARNCSGDRGHAGTRDPSTEGATNLRAGGGRKADGGYPNNLIHDGSEEVCGLFPSAVQARFFYSPKAANKERFGYCQDCDQVFVRAGNLHTEHNITWHPTVKPVDLMAYLVRLVTPPGGVVLDPFAGTGTTGKAAILEGMDPILIEQDPIYHKIITYRLRGPLG